MASRFRMSPVALSTIGALLGLIMIILICWLSGLSCLDTLAVTLLTTSIVLVDIFLEFTISLSSSSAVPPACLDGFIVETNGGTDGVDTCTTLHP